MTIIAGDDIKFQCTPLIHSSPIAHLIKEFSPTIAVSVFGLIISYQVFRFNKFTKALDAMKNFADICNSYLICDDNTSPSKFPHVFPPIFSDRSAIVSTIIKSKEFIDEYYSNFNIPFLSIFLKRDKDILSKLFKSYLHTSIIIGVHDTYNDYVPRQDSQRVLQTQFLQAREFLDLE